MSVPQIRFRPEVWGPPFWFFLHTVSQTYPIHPNEVVKRKYYDFFQNLPLFVPQPEISTYVAELLDRYPVTPYLKTRESLVRWVIFLHNKVNVALDKEEMNTLDAVKAYAENYLPRDVVIARRFGLDKQWLLGLVIVALFVLAFWKSRS